MKKYFALFSVLASTILVVCFISRSDATPKYSQAKNTSKLKPNNYWLNVRSHPTEGFDEKAYFKVISEINNLKKKSNSKDLTQDWSLEGPTNIGGRFNVITQSSRGSDTIYAGAGNGGVFRTTNGGVTWNPIFENQAFMSIGAISVHPTNKNIIYIGTGDRDFNGEAYNGNGLYRSTDFGSTWQNIGLSEVGIITDCEINPTNPSEMVVGALGDGFQKTNDRGIYYTSDAGTTWQNTLFVSDSSGVCDLERDPNNANILYAATYNRVNLFGNGIADGPDSKIYKSENGGLTWNQLTNGLPNTLNSRVGISVSESNPNTLFALYVNETYQVGGIYKSTDAGVSFTELSNTGALSSVLGGFGWYFGDIHVNPFNANHLIVPGVDMYESLDGGISWNLNVPEWFTYEVHADKHDVEFLNANDLMIATDGGLYKKEGTQDWEDIENIANTQFYDIEVNTNMQNVYAGGAQDNGTSSGNSSNLAGWSRDFGGDGFKVHYSIPNEKIIYETQNGNIYVVDNLNGFNGSISFDGDENLNWFTPYEYSDILDDIVIGSDHVLYSPDIPFTNAQQVSQNLTRTALGATTEARYHNIVELERKKTNEDHLLVGTSDGLIWKASNFLDETTYENITADLPEKYATSVNHSLVDENTFFVSFSGYYRNNSTPYIFKTSDGGNTWQAINGNLPQVGINDLLIADFRNDEVIFAATDGGVFLTENGGVTWDLVGNNLPTVTVTEVNIDYDNNKLVAGTFGRSIWSYPIDFLNLEESTATLDENEILLSVFPNPSSNFLNVESNLKQTFTVYSFSGKEIITGELLLGTTQINVSKYPEGSYILKTSSETLQFVVIH